MKLALTDKILSRITEGTLLIVIIASPWLFGAWEMWYFWPFAALIFTAGIMFTLRITLRCLFPDSHQLETLNCTRITIPAVSMFFIFLIYAAFRFAAAEVYMTAERSFLMFALPFILGTCIAIGYSEKQKSVLIGTCTINLMLIGIYGIANHFITGNEYVLWLKGFPQYVDACRATGPLFCPDHFSGLMEITAAIGAAIIILRYRKPGQLIGGILMVTTGLTGIILSQSRGGGATVLVLMTAILMWGLRTIPSKQRRIIRVSAVVSVILMITMLWISETVYAERFQKYFTPGKEAITLKDKLSAVKNRLPLTSRGRMYTAAVRVWRTRPMLGAGPGMHQNLWSRFATKGGDREKGIWPEEKPLDFHSYEVHNDWLQLLEEYGIAGFMLFLLASATVLIPIYRKTTRKLQPSLWPLASFFVIIALSFHSLGDFNLQIPAIAWIFTAIIATGISDAEQT